VLIGSVELLELDNVFISSRIVNLATFLKAKGKIVLFLSINGRLRALIALADCIRPDSSAVVKKLEAQGIKCYMITGDDEVTARAIGAEVGIKKDRIFARANPGTYHTKI
jgi:Cu+-exporting ATPase